MMIPEIWLKEARERIRPHIRETPLTYDRENDLFLKWENHQATGSFKVRGALNKVLTLQGWERERGLVTASAGNHGQGVALAGRLVEAPVTIFAAEGSVPAKIEAMRSLGAEVRLVPGGYGEAEQAGLAYARHSQATWVSPYNDGQVIAGQGTLALEVLDALPDPPATTWIIPAGGGGLLAGVGVALESAGKESRRALVAVQAEASAFLYNLFRRNTQDGVVDNPTLADGLAGPVEPGSVTIPLARRLVDDFVLVSEEAIAGAIASAWRRYGEVIEGAAAAALAAALTGRVSQRPAVVILSGGNIQPETHAEVLERIP